ncbi:hypothetical protein BC833DRAFT_583773 [Globomyces pollinis-pini]|nr:hypothetical protein BC833DRAFT_583773 [Globomyces pollinis-pini]
MATTQTSQIVKDLLLLNEQTWLKLGQVAEVMNEPEKAIAAYEAALRHNPYSEQTLTLIAALCRTLEKYAKAAEYFQRILKIHESNGEIWGALGHCYLMLDELQNAYSAYQQALYHLPNPKEPKLWYGIGILYDRYGSFEHAEDAFSAVIEMDPNFEKANEIYFRLGIIYKQEQKYSNSLECFKYILSCPPYPLTELDIWYQIGHLYEQQKEYNKAREAYEKVLAENPKHAKVLQQLGWLYQQTGTSFMNQDMALTLLTRSVEADQNDAQTWYLMGRCYMAQKKFNDAYNSYQQAVYRDGQNPTFWCSIGVLYYQINQYSDALDAYSRAIRINPYISEVWYDLGTLYESCENQTADALDAYTKALEYDPNNQLVKQRLEYLKNPKSGNQGQPQPQQPVPQDLHPTKYGSSAPSNFRTPYSAGEPPRQMQADRRRSSKDWTPRPSLATSGPQNGFSKLATPSQRGHPNHPPPPHHHPGQPPTRPIMLGPQLNRAGLPANEDDSDHRQHQHMNRSELERRVEEEKRKEEAMKRRPVPSNEHTSDLKRFRPNDRQ